MSPRYKISSMVAAGTVKGKRDKAITARKSGQQVLCLMTRTVQITLHRGDLRRRSIALCQMSLQSLSCLSKGKTVGLLRSLAHPRFFFGGGVTILSYSRQKKRKKKKEIHSAAGPKNQTCNFFVCLSVFWPTRHPPPSFSFNSSRLL